jgi:K+-transporting ATPase ATPase C chain
MITGVIYPLTVTAIAQAAFPWQANGSLLNRDGQPAGSALIGQPFDDPRYFWGRLSATAPFPYNAAASSGSDLGPTNPALLDQVKARIAALKQADPTNTASIPVDLVTASGSGLDPDISPAAAEYQVHRVARARSLDEAVVRRLIAEATAGPTFGLLGESRVNVLELNMALDRLQSSK